VRLLLFQERISDTSWSISLHSSRCVDVIIYANNLQLIYRFGRAMAQAAHIQGQVNSCGTFCEQNVPGTRFLRVVQCPLQNLTPSDVTGLVKWANYSLNTKGQCHNSLRNLSHMSSKSHRCHVSNYAVNSTEPSPERRQQWLNYSRICGNFMESMVTREPSSGPYPEPD
jgi:hypothetical protein